MLRIKTNPDVIHHRAEAAGVLVTPSKMVNNSGIDCQFEPVLNKKKP